MKPEKKPKRKPREWKLIEDPSGIYIADPLDILGPLCTEIRVREVLPRRKPAKKGAKRA